MVARMRGLAPNSGAERRRPVVLDLADRCIIDPPVGNGGSETAMSAGRADWQASSISRAVSIFADRDTRRIGNVHRTTHRVTRAPSSRRAAAMAWPCWPEERFAI